MQIVLIFVALCGLVHGASADELTFAQQPLAGGNHAGTYDTRILDEGISTFVYDVLSDWTSPGGVAISDVRQKNYQ